MVKQASSVCRYMYVCVYFGKTSCPALVKTLSLSLSLISLARPSRPRQGKQGNECVYGGLAHLF